MNSVHLNMIKLLQSHELSALTMTNLFRAMNSAQCNARALPISSTVVLLIWMNCYKVCQVMRCVPFDEEWGTRVNYMMLSGVGCQTFIITHPVRESNAMPCMHHDFTLLDLLLHFHASGAAFDLQLGHLVSASLALEACKALHYLMEYLICFYLKIDV